MAKKDDLVNAGKDSKKNAGNTDIEAAEIIDLAMKRFKSIEGFEADQRQQMKDDRNFAIGSDTWTRDERTSRETPGYERPCLNIPRIVQFLDYVKNSGLQDKAEATVVPVSDGAQEKFAKNRQGLMKHIQLDSKAELAHNKMYSDTVDMGRGHCVVNTKYLSETSFDQKIIIDTIKDPLDVYMDTRRKEPDYSDCKYGFILQKVLREDFEKDYPWATVSQWSFNDDSNDNFWMDEDYIVVAEYYSEEEFDDEVWEVKLTLPNGEEITTNVLKSEAKDDVDKDDIIRSRNTKTVKWVWRKITAENILEEIDLVCKEIPIVTMIGKETVSYGNWSCQGLTRNLKDSAKMYNYVSSTEAEHMNQSVKAPYMVTSAQIEGFKEWETVNNIPHPYLRYRHKDGQPPPMRIQGQNNSGAYVQSKQEIINDMMAISGLNQSNFGQRSNESSGVAIRERKVEGDTQNFHFPHNFDSALTHEGRIINSMLTTYYDIGRTITIMGEDDEVEMKQIGEEEASEIFSLGEGDFGVVVKTKASFATRREEASQNMIETARFIPQVGQSSGDLIVKAMDWPMKDEIANRTKNLIDLQMPGVTKPMEDESNQMNALQNQLQQADQQMQQMGQQMQQMQQQLAQVDQAKMAMDQAKVQDLTARTQLEAQKMKLDSEAKQKELAIKEQEVKIDAMKLDISENNKMQIAQMDNQSKESIAILSHQGDAQANQGRLAMENKKVEADILFHHTNKEREILNPEAAAPAKSEAVNIKMPAMKAPNIKIDMPEIKISMPEIKMPDMPDVNVNVNMEASKKTKKKIIPKDGGFEVEEVEIEDDKDD